MSEELKACPFCGGEAKFKDDSEDCGLPTFTIQCKRGDCHFAMSEDSGDVVVEAWNRRPSPPPSSEMREALRFLEWSNDNGEDEVCCPKCYAYRYEGKHRPTCIIGIALATPSAEIAEFKIGDRIEWFNPAAVCVDEEPGTEDWIVSQCKGEDCRPCSFMTGKGWHLGPNPKEAVRKLLPSAEIAGAEKAVIGLARVVMMDCDRGDEETVFEQNCGKLMDALARLAELRKERL